MTNSKLKAIYVWIEDFKNIKQTGFNLSADYYVKEDNRKFVINRKEKYIPYYPSNVNLKAFIGKNGSGKSAILEFLLLFSSNLKNLGNLKGFVIYLDENSKTFFVRKNGDYSIQLDEILNKENYKIDETKVFAKNYSIHINYGIDLPSSKFWEIFKLNRFRFNKPYYINNRINFNLIPMKSKNRIYIDLINKSIASDFFFIKRELNLNEDEISNLIKDVFKDENFVFYPQKFKLNLNRIRYLFELEGVTGKKININLLFETFEKANFSLFKLEKNNMIQNKRKLALLNLIYLFLKYPDLFKELISTSTKDKKVKTVEILKLINDLINKFSKEENLNENNKDIQDEEIDIIIQELINFRLENFDALYLKDKLIDKVYKYDKPIVEYLYYVVEPKKSIGYFLEFSDYYWGEDFLKDVLPPFIDIDLIDTKGRKLSDLSFGEKLLNFLLFRILRVVIEAEDIYRNSIDTFNILYDEFDIGLHPEMQRRFIKFLLQITQLVNEYSKEKLGKELYFNIFLSTHSPFIISDIPKENISFLENGKEKEEFKENENTFGANLYDILEKGFFLKNSIGNYSEEFIQTLSTTLALKLGILYFKRFEHSFILRKLFEEKNVNLENINVQEIEENFEDYLRKLIDSNLISYFVENNQLKLENIEFYIKNIIGEPIIRKNLINTLEEIRELEENES